MRWEGNTRSRWTEFDLGLVMGISLCGWPRGGHSLLIFDGRHVLMEKTFETAELAEAAGETCVINHLWAEPGAFAWTGGP